MILATGKDTGRTAYIFVREITRTEKMKGSSGPFTRVFLDNPKEGHHYFLDVTESPEEISRRIKEERHYAGRGAKYHEDN